MQACGEEAEKHAAERNRERGAERGSWKFWTNSSTQEALWLKMWNIEFNMVSRGFGKQRCTYQVKNTVSDICARWRGSGKRCRVQGKRRRSVSITIQLGSLRDPAVRPGGPEL